MRASAATAEYASVRADEPNFIAPDPPFIITTEHVIVAHGDTTRSEEARS